MASDDPCLDVTLRKAGLVRSCRIAPASWDGLKWLYERRGPDGFGACYTLRFSEALERRRVFDAEIAAARDDGRT